MSGQDREIFEELKKLCDGLPRPNDKGLISRVWSDYLSQRLVKSDYDRVCLEYPCEKSRGRLDAAIWKDKKDRMSAMDLAIEWEWDPGKNEEFAKGDFVKLLTEPAKAGLAIIKIGRTEENVKAMIGRIKRSYNKNKKDNRPVGVIEIRKLIKERGDNVRRFECRFYDLGNKGTGEPEVFKSLEYAIVAHGDGHGDEL